MLQSLAQGVGTTPRPLPARIPLRGRYTLLEPLHPRHAAELWRAAQGADETWAHLPEGPFGTPDSLARHVAALASTHDPMVWAVRPVATGEASGWLALRDIRPRHAGIELGGIWFGPRLQRTRAGTEAIYLLLRLAADDLGYRRLAWQCDSRDEASRRAALRLGFTPEGRFRAHRAVRGDQRDTDWFSIVAEEWPACRDALLAWLDPSNFAADGTALRGLSELRSRLP